MKRIYLILLLSSCTPDSEKDTSGIVDYYAQIDYAERIQIEELERDSLND